MNDVEVSVSLLLDANLSWRTTSVLQEYFGDCRHVDSIGLNVPAKDIEIWEYALRNNMTIVSNDEDFLSLLLLKGFPPKVVLLKTGNQSRKRIEEILIVAKSQIVAFLQSEEHGLLEII